LRVEGRGLRVGELEAQLHSKEVWGGRKREDRQNYPTTLSCPSSCTSCRALPTASSQKTCASLSFAPAERLPPLRRLSCWPRRSVPASAQQQLSCWPRRSVPASAQQQLSCWPRRSVPASALRPPIGLPKRSVSACASLVAARPLSLSHRSSGLSKCPPAQVPRPPARRHPPRLNPRLWNSTIDAASPCSPGAHVAEKEARRCCHSRVPCRTVQRGPPTAEATRRDSPPKAPVPAPTTSVCA